MVYYRLERAEERIVNRKIGLKKLPRVWHRETKRWEIHKRG